MSTALLIIDVQQALFEKGTPIYRADDLLNKLCGLAAQAHAGGVPVFYIQHCNDSFLLADSAGWQLHPRLQPETGDIMVRKHHANAFEKTDLHARLQELGVSRVVIGGLVTHGCVRAACEGAQTLGYQVTLVSDGHSSFHRQAARLVDEWNQRLSTVGIDVRPACEIEFE